MIPTPIGMSSIGSKSYLIARNIKKKATRIITKLPLVAFLKPVKAKKLLNPAPISSPIDVPADDSAAVISFTTFSVTVPVKTRSAIVALEVTKA